MTPEQRAEIRERAAAATPGPWVQDGDAIPWSPRQRSPFIDQGANIECVKPADNGSTIFIVMGGAQDEQGGAVGVLTNEDAAFIAHARTDIPALLADNEALEERLREALLAETFRDLAPYVTVEASDLDGSRYVIRLTRDELNQRDVVANLTNTGDGWTIELTVRRRQP